MYVRNSWMWSKTFEHGQKLDAVFYLLTIVASDLNQGYIRLALIIHLEIYLSIIPVACQAQYDLLKIIEKDWISPLSHYYQDSHAS